MLMNVAIILEATQIAHYHASTTKPQVIKAQSLPMGIKPDQLVHPMYQTQVILASLPLNHHCLHKIESDLFSSTPSQNTVTLLKATCLKKLHVSHIAALTIILVSLNLMQISPLLSAETAFSTPEIRIR